MRLPSEESKEGQVGPRLAAQITPLYTLGGAGGRGGIALEPTIQLPTIVLYMCA
jgi:hypothetical protein